MDRLVLSRPRQWGACWLTLKLWDELALDDFWTDRLPPSREGTSWLNVLKTLVTYRLIDPGSEWRLHRLWFDRSAMADLLGEELGDALLRRSGPLPGPEDSVTWLLAVSIADGPHLTGAVHRLQAARSARRAPMVSVRMDPVTLR